MFIFCHSCQATHYPDGPLLCLVFKRCPSCSAHVLITLCLFSKRTTGFAFFFFSNKVNPFLLCSTSQSSNLKHRKHLWSQSAASHTYATSDIWDKSNWFSIQLQFIRFCWRGFLGPGHSEYALSHNKRALYKWDQTVSLCHSSASFTAFANRCTLPHCEKHIVKRFLQLRQKLQHQCPWTTKEENVHRKG